MDRVSFSVVIPTFNRAELVKNAIGCALRQTHPPAEVIVVNDGSSDHTAEVLASYGNRIKAINQPNQGLSGARNAGIQAASNDWVAFLDDDDEYVSERLARAAESIATDPAAGVHATNSALIASNGEETDLFKLRGYDFTGNILLERPLEWIFRGCFFAQSWVVRRADLLAVGLFRKTYYEDMDIAIRLARHTRWRADARRSLRVIRRANETNLSGQWRSKPVENFKALVRIYREALTHPALSPREHEMAQSGLSSYLFELGCAQLLLDQPTEGRAHLREAATTFPKLRSRMKARIVLLAGPAAARHFQRRRQQRTQVRT